MLEIKSLHKNYGNHEVLKGVSITLKPGEALGIAGPNGVGKTTLIESICGIVRITKGEMYLNGQSLLMSPYINRHKIGICFQDSIFDRFFSIYNTLVNNAMYHGLSLKESKEKSEFWLRKLDLWNKRAAFGNELSGGMKKRFQVAVALVHDPDLLILDEPTAGVDLGLVDEIYAILQSFMSLEGKMLILTSHNINEIKRLCNKILFLKDGKIVHSFSKKALDLEPIDLEIKYREVYLNASNNSNQA